MSAETSNPMERLTEQFRGLVDEALIQAIGSDHDLKNPFQFRLAHDTLQSIADTVPFDEATGFNPSGLSGPQDDVVDNKAADGVASQSTASTSQTSSPAHITESSSTDNSSEAAYVVPKLTTFNAESEEVKTLYLRKMFAGLKEYDITYALKKTNGNFQGALDHLLNVQHLQSTGQQTKGIDAFFSDEDGAEPVKGSKKSRRKARQKSKGGIPNFELPAKNPENEIKYQDEIAFIADRINVPYGEVSDVYHRKKHISGATVVELLDKYMSLGIKTEGAEGIKQAQQLASDHANVPKKYMPTLVQMVDSDKTFANDIATLLSKHFAKNPWKQKLDLTHRLTPLPDEELDNALPTGPPKKRGSPTASPTASPRLGPVDYGEAIKCAVDSSNARRDAESYAAQLHRRGAGNHLYRQAAVVYSDRARESARVGAAATSSAADALVNQQSKSNQTDLHGVYVRDGVRIALQRVNAWWQGLGEGRTRRAKQEGFTIITGVGKHSAGGVSQLRQAVAAALLQDGWKLTVETGRFVVNGRR